MTNTPSDAEIVALAISEGIKVRTGAGAVRLVRAALAEWGTPQPVVREPLSANQVSELAESAGYWHGDRSRADFINGIRYAEAAHGITQKGGSVTAPAVASEPIAYLYDDGSWTPAKTEEGRKLNDWMISAGSPKIGVHLASTAQPTPLTTLAQATQAGNQQEARPCHVFTVRKAGGLTEWEPTTMALALPDGAHALYTLPQPSPHAHADSVTAPMRQGKWTWVPVEPSTAMLVAGNHGRPGDFSALKVWEDMLGALDRSFDYTRPVDPPSTNPPAQAADRMLEDAALLLESQHTWLTNIAAANLVRSLAARARLGEKT